MNLESFCFQVLDEHDTIRDEPDVQEVMREIGEGGQVDVIFGVFQSPGG